MARAALGFADHSGWAVAVTVAEAGGWFQVVARERLELLRGDLPRQPYHAVAEQGFPRETIERVSLEATARASAEVRRLIAQVRPLGHELLAAGVPIGTTASPGDLDAILGSHMKLHAAEGQLYREALAEGAAAAGLEVFRAPRADVPALAAAEAGIPAGDFAARLAEAGKVLGPPWQGDHKLAAALAWLALSGGPSTAAG